MSEGLRRHSSVSDIIPSPSTADKSVEKLAKLTGEVIFSPAGKSEQVRMGVILISYRNSIEICLKFIWPLSSHQKEIFVETTHLVGHNQSKDFELSLKTFIHITAIGEMRQEIALAQLSQIIDLPILEGLVYTGNQSKDDSGYDNTVFFNADQQQSIG